MHDREHGRRSNDKHRKKHEQRTDGGRWINKTRSVSGCYQMMEFGEQRACVRVVCAACQNAASFCRAFKRSRRRDVLSFAHHAEVAGRADANESSADRPECHPCR